MRQAASRGRQFPLALPHRPALAREDFLVAASNSAAVAWIDRWPEWPAAAVVIVGPRGSGKTHLGQVWRAVSGAVEIAVEALQRGSASELLGAARACLIDDAEKAAGDPAAEETLFHLYNLLLERRGQLLLTAQRPPARWPLHLKDLASRLATLLPVELGRPDDALMHALLSKLFADRQLRPGRGVVEFLLARIERSQEAARRVVEEIDRKALRERREIRLPLVREVVEALDEPPLDLDDC